MSQLLLTHAAMIVVLVFGAMALCAIAFVTWPASDVRGGPRRRRALLAIALSMFIVGVGGGVYLIVGSPELAREAVAGPEANGIKGLVVELAKRMRERPHDATGWTLLGRGYLTLGDPGQAAVAFRRASALAAPEKKPELLSAYGEAVTLAQGTVTPDAEAAFRGALAGNPKDFAARYYLGRAYSERGDAARARELWQSLLADAPSNAPWRVEVTTRLATLEPSAVNVQAMVDGLAARLRMHPDDPAGWQKLLRSYMVLGEKQKAQATLLSARTALRGQAQGLAAIEAEARLLKVQTP
jgi:cytochrome c-type biogenesis protein CcmH